MQKGFYSSPDIDEALLGLVSQDDNTIDGMWFLHGVCGIFALALQDTFNYDIGWILDDDELNESDNPWHHLVHIFCYHETDDGTVIYVDVRGSQSDLDKFQEPFDDFYVEPEYEYGLSYDDLKDSIGMDMSAEEFAVFYNAAVQFINQERDFYSPKRIDKDEFLIFQGKTDRPSLEFAIKSASTRAAEPRLGSQQQIYSEPLKSPER